MNKVQKLWCKNYEQETGFDPLMDDFKAGNESFEFAALKSVKWFEDWSVDALHAIDKIPTE